MFTVVDRRRADLDTAQVVDLQNSTTLAAIPSNDSCRNYPRWFDGASRRLAGRGAGSQWPGMVVERRPGRNGLPHSSRSTDLRCIIHLEGLIAWHQSL